MARTLSQIYFVLTSISNVFTGMNCILFFFCVYVLWGQKSKSRGVLLFSSVVQFCLCLAQAALYISYVIVVFTAHAEGLELAESHFLQISDLSLPCYIIFTLNFAIEGFLLIWRIYILYSNNIMICIPSIILLALQVGLGGATTKGFATEQVIAGRLQVFNLITWALIAAVNISATILICIRLWIAHQRANTILSLSKYKSTIIVVVECGALVTISTIVMFVLYAIKHPIGIASLGLTTQVATMAPLLIIARHGLASRRDDRRALASQIPLRIGVTRTKDTHVDIPVESSTRKNQLSDSFPEFSGGNHSKPFCDA